ncbi:MAG: hypothetical protein JWQ40_4293 [Segetibacter sp.]|nr:hypothetical protein [Segetibacter sp.]
MKYKTRYDLSHITSVDALRREQAIVKGRIKDRESELRLKMYEIPAELAAAGANSMIPKIFRGKITNGILNGGKKLINGFLVPQDQSNQNLLTNTIKSRGVFDILKKGFNIWRGRK